MIRAITRTALVVVLALAASTESARAAPPEADTEDPAQRTRADELFKEGRQLMRDGRTTEACTAFEQSLALQTAGGTLLNLSRCYEALGRLASADAALDRAWRLGRGKGRADAVAFIESERSRLAPLIDRVILLVDPLPPGAVVELDGQEVTERSAKVTRDIDPGMHQVRVHAPSHVDVETRFELPPRAGDESRTVEVRVPAPRPREAPRRATPPSRGADRATPDVAPRASKTGDDENAAHTASTVALVGGGLLLASGLVIGAVAAAQWASVEERCPNVACNDAGARASADDAAVTAGIATGLVIGGLAVGGVGVALRIAAPGWDDGARPERRAELRVGYFW